MDITTRAEAIAAGLDRYFTGKQCANGHLSPRYVSQHRCVDCRAERDKKYRTENIRITGQLIDAVTGTHMWADRFERDLTDIFALQDEVTVAIVSAIQPKLLQTEIAMAARRRPENLTAYDFFLRAMQQYYLTTREGVAEALGTGRNRPLANPKQATKPRNLS